MTTLHLIFQLITAQHPVLQSQPTPPSHPTGSETCLASTYGAKDDRYSGDKTAWRALDPSITPGVAHRTLPLGSWVRVCVLRNQNCAALRVIDRGPYGKLDSRGKWFNGCPSCSGKLRPGKWRGCLDITPPAARQLQFKGMEMVEVSWKSQLERQLKPPANQRTSEPGMSGVGSKKGEPTQGFHQSPWQTTLVDINFSTLPMPSGHHNPTSTSNQADLNHAKPSRKTITSQSPSPSNH